MKPSLFSIALAVSLLGCGGEFQEHEPFDAGPDSVTVDRQPPLPHSESGDAAAEPAVAEPTMQATVNGAFRGKAFVAEGGGLLRFQWDSNEPSSPQPDYRAGVNIILTQYPQPCSSPRVPLLPALALYLHSAEVELGPGTFPIVASYVSGGQGTPPQGTANIYGLYAEDCGVSNLDQSTEGTVTLSVVDGKHIEGSFDLTFVASGSFSGSFSLEDCRGAIPGDDTDPTMRCVL